MNLTACKKIRTSAGPGAVFYEVGESPLYLMGDDSIYDNEYGVVTTILYHEPDRRDDKHWCDIFVDHTSPGGTSATRVFCIDQIFFK